MDKIFCDVCGDEITFGNGVVRKTMSGSAGNCSIGHIPGVRGFPNNIDFSIKIRHTGLDITDICFGCVVKWMHMEMQVRKKEKRLGKDRQEWMKFKKKGE